MKKSIVKLGTASLLLSIATAIPSTGIAEEAKNVTQKRVLHYKTVMGGYFSQSYEIELFDNGDVVYTGLNDVRQIGVVKWRVRPEQITSLVKVVWHQYDDAPAYQGDVAPIQPPPPPPIVSARAPELPPADGGRNLNPHLPINTAQNEWHLAVVHQREVRASARGWVIPSFDKWVRESLEQAVPTKSVRCPFLTTVELRLSARRVLPVGADLCEYQSEIDGFTSNFITK